MSSISLPLYEPYWNYPIDSRPVKVLVCIPVVSYLFVLFKQRQLERELQEITSQIPLEQLKALKNKHWLPLEYRDLNREEHVQSRTYLIQWKKIFQLSLVAKVGFCIQIFILPKLLFFSSISPGVSCLLAIACLVYIHIVYRLGNRFDDLKISKQTDRQTR